MGRWIAILLAAMLALAVVGLLVDAARAIVGVLLVVCVLVLVGRWLLARRR